MIWKKNNSWKNAHSVSNRIQQPQSICARDCRKKSQSVNRANHFLSAIQTANSTVSVVTIASLLSFATAVKSSTTQPQSHLTFHPHPHVIRTISNHIITITITSLTCIFVHIAVSSSGMYPLTEHICLPYT